MIDEYELQEKEVDFAGMSNDENCGICLQPITNPMGQECYLKHVDMWLDDQGLGIMERSVVIDYIRGRLPKNNSNQAKCVVCNDEYLSVCSYCFVFTASRVLRELSFTRNFEEDFEYMFSYKGGRI